MLAPLVTNGGRDTDNIQSDPSRLVNFHWSRSGAKPVLRRVLGTSSFASTDSVFMRDMHEVGGFIYSVVGGGLYCTDQNGTTTLLGNVADSADTEISSNNGDLAIAAGGNYYFYDTSAGALSEPSGGAFDAVGSVEYLSQYTVLTERNGGRFAWTDVADASSLDATQFATAEANDDNLLRAVSIAGNLWLFGEESIEIWGLTGQSGAEAFQRVAGGVIDVGLKEYGLVAGLPNGAFFVGSDNIASVTSGAGRSRVSTSAIEGDIANSTPTRCFYYEDEGHKFCVIRFSDRPAWVYDLVSEEWHERAFGSGHQAWPAVSSVKLAGSWFLGTDRGNIQKFTRSNRDAEAPLVSTVTSQTLYNEGRRTRVSELEFFLTFGESYLGRDRIVLLDAGGGAALKADDGALLIERLDDAPRDAMMWIELSSDGRTYGQAKQISLGDRGDYERRALYRGLGAYRRLNVKASISDPTEITLDAQVRLRLS